MPDAPEPPPFELSLPYQNIALTFPTVEEFKKWNQEEWNKWQWIMNAQTLAPNLQNIAQNINNQVNQIAEEWRQQGQNIPNLPNVFQRLRNTLEGRYGANGYLNLSEAEAVFLTKVKIERGDIVAAGAYMTIVKANNLAGGQMAPPLFEGLIVGYLFKNEVDWTATTHKAILEQLEKQYQNQILGQDTQFQTFEKNAIGLTNTFDATLKTKAEALDQLQKERSDIFQTLNDAQIKEFETIKQKHLEELKAIQTTYDQTLALSKPVEYWKAKEKYHNKYSKIFGYVSLSSLAVVLILLGVLVHWVFAGLKPTDNPSHWQVSILVVAAFFSVWVIRILIRLFFSHVHLATDAAERSIMILTYLAMSREGSQFAPDDKTLIIQHLFRSASDGLVKDDAAPPGVLELLTRK